MTNRSKRRARLGKGLDSISALLDAQDSTSVPDLNRLTPAERAQFVLYNTRLQTAAASAAENGTDPDEAMLQEAIALSYFELCEWRAIEKKARGELLDGTDIERLKSIADGTRDAELKESNWLADYKAQLHAGIPFNPIN